MPPMHGSVAGQAWIDQERHSLPLWCSRGDSNHRYPFQGSLFDRTAKSVYSIHVIPIPMVFKYFPILNESVLTDVQGSEDMQISVFHRPRFRNLMQVVCEIWGCTMIFGAKSLVFLLWMTHTGFAVPSTLIEVEEECKPKNVTTESRSGYLVPWMLGSCNIVSDGVGSSPARSMCLNSSKTSRIETQGLTLSRCLYVLLHLEWREEKQKLVGQIQRETWS